MIDAEFLAGISIESPNSAPKLRQAAKKPLKLKKPRGGYRPVLANDQQLAQEALELGPLMTVIDQNELSDQDKVSFFTLLYLNQRYPNNFLESANPIVRDHIVSSSLIDQLPIKFKNPKATQRLKQLNIKSLFDVVNGFDLHSVPYSARFTLVNWYLGGRFDLVLFVNRIPSSKQVLRMQANSKRCVSLIADKLDELVMGERDPFSFLLHDLVHAYKMFANDYLLKGQIGFYRALLRLFSTDNSSSSILDELISVDTEFRDQFDYLISDMNSHPRHLFFYFKAILILAVKRKHGIESGGRLNGESLVEFERLFEGILDRFEMDEAQRLLAKQIIADEDNRLNSKPSNLVDFELLDRFFLNIK